MLYKLEVGTVRNILLVGTVVVYQLFLLAFQGPEFFNNTIITRVPEFVVLLAGTEMIAHLPHPSPIPKLWSEKVFALLLSPPRQHLNFCTVRCSQVFLDRKHYFQHQLVSSSSFTRVPPGLASSRPAPVPTAVPSCITSYTYAPPMSVLSKTTR